MTTAVDVAAFMLKELEHQGGYLYQEVVVYQIVEKFGEGFTGTNRNGNPSINSDVLDAFRALTPEYVWVRADRMWRKREPDFDKPGRMQ